MTLTVKGTSHRKDFKWKKYGGTGLISEKTEALYVELNERAAAAISSYSAPDDFSQHTYSVFWLRIKRKSKVFSSWIFLHKYFLTILIMVNEQLYWRKIICGCFRICLWLLISIMKRCAERCALHLYHTSLILLAFEGVFSFSVKKLGKVLIVKYSSSNLSKT